MLRSTRIFILTLLAMIAFASNSLLCRASLKESSIDPATFTFVRIFSGALALWLVMSVRKMLTINRTATPLVDSFSNPAPVTDARHFDMATGFQRLRYSLTRRAFHLRIHLSQPEPALCFCLEPFRLR